MFPNGSSWMRPLQRLLFRPSSHLRRTLNHNYYDLVGRNVSQQLRRASGQYDLAPVIGLHLRTRHSVKTFQTMWKRLVEVARDVATSNGASVVYVATDSVEALEYCKEVFLDSVKVVTMEGVIDRASCAGMTKTMLDMLMLSLSDTIILSDTVGATSTFALCATRYSANSNLISYGGRSVANVGHVLDGSDPSSF